MDLFSELVDCDVRRCTYEDLSGIHFGQMVDDGSGCDCLSCTWGSLNETEWFLQDALDGKDLAHVEFWEIWSRHSNLSFDIGAAYLFGICVLRA